MKLVTLKPEGAAVHILGGERETDREGQRELAIVFKSQKESQIQQYILSRTVPIGSAGTHPPRAPQANFTHPPAQLL